MGGGAIAATRPTLSRQLDPHYQHHLKHNLCATLPVPLCDIHRRYIYCCLTQALHLLVSTSTPLCIYCCLPPLLSATHTTVCLHSCLPHTPLSASTPVCHTHHCLPPLLSATHTTNRLQKDPHNQRVAATVG